MAVDSFRWAQIELGDVSPALGKGWGRLRRGGVRDGSESEESEHEDSLKFGVPLLLAATASHGTLVSASSVGAELHRKSILLL